MKILTKQRRLTVLCALILVLASLLAEQLFPALRQTVTEPDSSVQLPIAMYHHLLKAEHRTGDYVITPTQFEDDLRYLQTEGYTTVTLSQILAFLTEGTPLPDKPILLTFDDGYESVYAYAFPLLRQYGMHAVVSIIGRYTDEFSKEGVPRHLNYSHLSWDQLSEMLESGVFEIGNHSYDMHAPRDSDRYGICRCRGEDAETYRGNLLQDVGQLNDAISHRLDIRPILFAYPFGAGIREGRPLLTDMGFSILLTCEEKVNRLRPGSLPVSLCRFNRSGRYDTAVFFRKLAC